MRMVLGFATTLFLLLGLVGCSAEKANNTTKEKKVEAIESRNVEVNVKSVEMVSEMTEKNAIEFYEQFSEKIINKNTSKDHSIELFFEKPNEPGFYYGLPEGALYESATNEVKVYYQLLTDIVGIPLENSDNIEEKHTYTIVENNNDKIDLIDNYEVMVEGQSYKEKREVIVKFDKGQLKIERFDALQSPVVDIMKKANQN